MIRLAIRVRVQDAEIALAELLELAPGGVEEVSHPADPDFVEYAIYGAPGELPELPDLEAAAGDALVEISTREVADDWADRWRAFHRPVRVAERLHVRPPWEPADEDGLLDIVIDPGQAFGTGGHHTTRLCLELLLDLDPSGPFVDLGCGSGVLAIAAAKLGWSPVLGVDHEAESVDATRENAEVNGVEVQAQRGDLRGAPAPTARTVVANLVRPLLLAVAQQGFDGEPPQAFVASGLLRHEADEVAAAFGAHGLVERRRLSSGEWTALLLVRD